MEPILLIDDDVELCSMLSDYLGRHDYQVTLAHDGKTGLAKALGGSYSITLLDVMLPGLDGFEVLRRLRASASPMSVLLLTARGPVNVNTWPAAAGRESVSSSPSIRSSMYTGLWRPRPIAGSCSPG